MSFKAIVFDLDGTLLDSLHDIANSMNAALARKGFPPHPVVDYKIHVGDGLSILARRVLPKKKINDAVIAELVAIMREEYGRRWAVTTRPYAGIAEMLDELTHRGLKLSIVSNKPHDFSQQVTARLLSSWRFDPVIGERAGIPHKPDPANALAAAAGMGVAPAECIFLGDTHVDIHTAVNAGMFPAGALWGFRGEKELRDAGAKILLKHPAELLGIL
ncbi:MAG TPA: HAD family hydrolase [Planctomycetota bacterium]|nr:HAD family hydrolase [Planctomycetota bacterium]